MATDNNKRMGYAQINFNEYLPPQKGKTRMIQPCIEEETYDALRECMKVTGLNMSETVDSVLKAYIAWEKQRRKKR